MPHEPSLRALIERASLLKAIARENHACAQELRAAVQQARAEMAAEVQASIDRRVSRMVRRNT